MTETAEITPLSNDDMRKLVDWAEVHVFRGNEYRKLGLKGLLSAIQRFISRKSLSFDGTITEESIKSAIAEVNWNKNFECDDDERYPFDTSDLDQAPV